jgi:hypothetical protein
MTMNPADTRPLLPRLQTALATCKSMNDVEDVIDTFFAEITDADEGEKRAAYSMIDARLAKLNPLGAG